MRFNKLILDKAGSFLKENGFNISEQFEGYLKFRSADTIFLFTNNIKDKQSTFYVGKDEDHLYPIDEYVLKYGFDCDLKINYVPEDIFIDNILLFLKNKGFVLIEGNEFALEAIEKWVYKKTKEYTNALLIEQNLKIADKAWKEVRYDDFIKTIEKMEREELPHSYILKYEIAKKALGY